MDERQRLVPQPELDAPLIDQAAPLQQHEPCVSADQQRRPQRQQHRDHAEIGRAAWKLRENVRERIAEQHADRGGHEADLERRAERARVRRLLDHATVVGSSVSEAVVGKQRQAEQPADRQQHRHEPAGTRPAWPRRRTAGQASRRRSSAVGRHRAGVGVAREPRHRCPAPSAMSTASCAAKPNGATSPTAGTRPSAVALAMPRALMRLPSGSTACTRNVSP